MSGTWGRSAGISPRCTSTGNRRPTRRPPGRSPDGRSRSSSCSEILASELQAADDRARREIEAFRLAVESQPDSAAACNDLAWAYTTAPEHLRDPSRALALAERAAGLEPQ